MLFTSTSVSLANAEFDSMGDIVEGGVGIPNKTSPRRTAIQKVQVELRQECDFRDERRRELEFLENGGNPLDFKLENVSSVSVQSTSCTDQHPFLFETSEAKVSFACTTLPHGDSAESIGRPGTPHGEASSADNLMLFAIEREVSGSDRSSLHLSNGHVVPSEQSFQTDASHKTMEPGDSAAFDLAGKAYKRRYRSHTSRDGTRSSSTDVNPTCGSLNSSLPFCHGPRDIKEFVADSKYQHPTSNCNSESVNPIGDIHPKMVLTEGQRDTEFNYVKAVELDKDLVERVSIDPVSCTMAFGNPLNDQHNQQSLSVAIETPKKIGSKQPEVIQPMEEITSGVIECQPSITFVNQSSSCQLNDFSKTERDEITDDSHNNTSRTTNGMGSDSDLPCTQNNPCADGKTEKEICRMRKFDSNGNLKNQTLDVAPVVESDGIAVVESEEVVTEKKKTENFESSALFVEKTIFARPSQQNGIAHQPQEELNQNSSTLKNEARNQFNSEDREASRINGSESGRRPAVPKFGSGNDEDSILKEAKVIEEKRKRIMELLIEPFPVDIHVKSKWDFVLEEMAWMANDFAQERIWKIAAASELCYRATFSSRLRKQEEISGMEAKKVAHTLSKAVIGFWHSVTESSKELDDQQSQKTGAFSVLTYAVRFLKYNTLNVFHNRAEFPPTPDSTSDLRTLDASWEENLTEENLFYTIPPGAIEMYKKSIESHVAQCKRIGASALEEVETSACDTAADFPFEEIMYEDDEEEMSTYDMAVAFDNNKPARFCQNKRKQLTHAYGARSFDVDSSLLAVRYTDNKVLRQPSSLMVKRPCSSLNVSIPTKRVRTAYRRVMSPFSAGTSGCMLRPNKTEASSGDTSSFQDDHSTLHGASLVPNSLESELGGEFGKQLPLDTAEVSTKSKKRSKHLRVHWKNESDSCQLESNGAEGFLVQPMMKMLKMQQPHDSSFDDILPVGGSVTSPVASQMSNMSNSNKIIKVIVAHDRGRKPKAMMMPAGQPGSGSPWSLFEDQALVVLVHDLGPNWELISDAISGTLHFKCIFRKPKVCKERHHTLMDGTSGDGADSAEDSGSSQPYRSTLPGIPKGSARQLFQRLQEPMEEDTLNSHFDKIITIGQKQHYRKTQEPKQLQQPHNSHAILLSQVSPNNLSGGPVLTPLDFYDATIVGPDMLAVGNQGQLSSVLTNPNHGSVAPMLSASGASSTFHGSSITMLGNSLQSSPGSLNSTVRDSRYGVPRSASITIDEQRMQQYSQVISGRNSSQHNTFAPGTLPVTDRVRILSGGNGMGMVSGINKSMPTVRPGLQGIVSSSMLNSGSMLSPVVASANVHSVVGSGQGSSLLRPREPLHMMRPGMVQGSQRQMMVPDIQMQLSPGSQGMPQFGGLSSPSPNQTTSSQLSSYSLYNQQSHPVSPQQPQVISPNTHFQASARPNVQQHAYAIHLAKERQTRQRLLQQQPQQLQLVTSNSLVPHVHSSPQLPISSPVQTSPQVQPEISSPPVSLSPLTSTSSTNSMPQQQQKQHTHTQGGQGGGGNAQTGGIGLTNQISKQRQRQQQQFSLANRQHPQQRQLRQQAKVSSGVGRGNPILHQIVPIDQSQLNGFSTNLGNECLEKGEPATPLVQSQGLCTGSTQNSGQPPRQYTSSQSSNMSLPQKKECSGRAASSPKHPHQMTYHSDTNSQGHVSAVAPTSLPSVQQSISSLAVAGLNNQQVLPPRKSVNQIKSALQRVSQPNRSINSEPLVKPQANEFDTGKHQSSGPSEMDRLAKMESNAVNSETNLSSLESAVTNSSEPVPRAGQGLCQRPSASLPPLRHDVSAHWHQRPSHVQQHQRPVAQTQHPPLQQQQPLLPLHSQLQTQLHQTVKNNLYGSPGDTRI